MPKNIYSIELKLEIIGFVEQGHSADEAAAKYAIHPSHIRKWVEIYKEHGFEGLDRKTRRYTAEFKLQVVEDLRSNGLSYRQAAMKYNIGTHTSIQKWERIYLEQGLAGLMMENRGKTSKEANALKGNWKKVKEKAPDLIAEVQRLRMENEYLKKLNALVRSKAR